MFCANDNSTVTKKLLYNFFNLYCYCAQVRRVIKSYKKRYYSIGFIICPALKNEKVYFNNHGFNHLIRKRGVRRSCKDIKSRLGLKQ